MGMGGACASLPLLYGKYLRQNKRKQTKTAFFTFFSKNLIDFSCFLIFIAYETRHLP